MIPFIALPFMTRWLGPADFGRTGTFAAMVNVAVLLVGLSTHAQISAAYYRDGAGSLPSRVGASVGIVVTGSVLLLIVITANAQRIAALSGLPATWLWTVVATACGQFLVMTTLVVWQTRRQAWQFGATQVGYTLIWTALAVLLVRNANLGWTGRALGQALGVCMAAVICLVVLHRHGDIAWNPRTWPLRSALAFGIPVLPHSLGWVAMSTVDRFALAGFDAITAGYYFAAFQVASILTLGAAAVNQAWIPWLYARLARDDASARREVVIATTAIYGLLLGAGLVVGLTAEPVLGYVGGPEFAPAAMPLRYLAPAAAFIGMYYFASGYFFYSGRTGLLSTITVGMACVQTALTFALAARYGMQGVAIATLASAVVYWSVVALVANHLSPMPWFGSGMPAGRTAYGEGVR